MTDNEVEAWVRFHQRELEAFEWLETGLQNIADAINKLTKLLEDRLE